MAEVQASASPGLPYATVARSKGELLEMFGGEIRRLAVERLEKLMTYSVAEVMNLSVGEALHQGLLDPVRLFVKNEPHSEAKLAQGKYRLISSVSVVDELVERVLNGALNNAEILNCNHIWAKPGMGLHDEGLQALWESLGGKLRASTDMSNWDWSVSGFELGVDALVRGESMRAPEPWRRALLNRARLLAISPFVTSGGRVYVPTIPGIQKSGSYNTSSTNSRIRILCALAIGAAECAAMGDDAVETPVVDAQRKYSALGHVCKAYDVYEKGFEFCSHRFEDWEGYPVHPGKTLYRLAHTRAPVQDLKQHLEEFAWFMRHHPRKDLYLGVAEKVCDRT